MGSMKAQIEPALLQDCCTKIKTGAILTQWEK